MQLNGVTVLHVNPALHAGGAEVSVIDNSGALCEAGGRAIVASGPGRMVENLRAVGGEWIPFPAGTKNPGLVWRNISRFMKLMREFDVDIVHSHSRAPGWTAHYACKRMGIPHITSFHGIYGSTNRFKHWYNGVMASGDLVIANSSYTAGHIEGQYPEAIGRVRTIYPGINLNRFDPARISKTRLDSIRLATGLNPERRIVLLPGRISAIKGQDLLVAAAAELKSRGINGVQYVIMGEAGGKQKHLANLHEQMAQSGVGEDFLIAPHHADMPAVLMLADVVVAPTIRPESFGRTAAEASAMERLVIASDIGASRETIQAPPEFEAGQLTGWRFATGNPLSFANAIEHALSLDETTRKEIGRRGRRHIRENFSLASSNIATLAAYNEILNVGQNA